MVIIVPTDLCPGEILHMDTCVEDRKTEASPPPRSATRTTLERPCWNIVRNAVLTEDEPFPRERYCMILDRKLNLRFIFMYLCDE